MAKFAAAALAAAFSAGLAAATGTVVFGLSVAMSATLIGLGSFALSVVTSMMAPKPKMPNFASFESYAEGHTQQIRQAVTPHRLVFGEARISGPLVFAETTNSNAKLHLVVVLAAHEVAEIGTVYLHDVPVYSDQIDGAGEVTAGRFAGKVRIKKHLGTAGQVADADLVAETSATEDYRGRGRAYLYVRLTYDRDKFETGIPNISADVKGMATDDPRGTGAATWSANPVLALAHYLKDATYGLGLTDVELSAAQVATAADVCDEFVAVVPQGHLTVAVSAADDTIDLATAESAPYLRLQTGDRVRVAWVGEMPAGLAAATDYYVIVKRPQGYFTAAKTAVTLGSPSLAGDFATAEAAGLIDAFKATSAAPQCDPRIQLAASFTAAIAGAAIDITTAGTGTGCILKTAEPRYSLGGVIEADRAPRDIIADMLTSFAGKLIFAGGAWRILAGAYTAPTITLDEDDLHGGIRVTTKLGRRERFNAVKGIFVSPANAGQPTDYPVQQDDAFVTEDSGEEIFLDYDLPFTRRAQTAQRLARILLREHRQQIAVEARFNLAALRVQAGDTVALTNTRMGWSAKAFLVESLRFGADTDSAGGPILVVELTLRETASTVYDFTAAADETTVDPAPNTNLPSAFTVEPPSALALTSGTSTLFLKDDGTVVSRIRFDFTGSPDPFVDSYEVQYRKGAGAWTKLAAIAAEGGSPDAYFGYVWDVEDGAVYEVRVFAINQIGKRSDPLEVAGSPQGHTVIGKTALPEDVTGFAVQQNGNVVVFRWDQVGDADLAGYEIRYGSSATPWDDWTATFAPGTLLTSVTRGTQVTSAAVPPSVVRHGDTAVSPWTFAIKARDTSGNYSAAAATRSLTIANANTVIDTREQAPLWRGHDQYIVALGLQEASPKISRYGAASLTAGTGVVADLPGNAISADWSPDGALVAFGHAASPFVTIYETSGAWTKLADPATLPSAAVRVSFSPDSRRLAAGCGTVGDDLVVYDTADWSVLTSLATDSLSNVKFAPTAVGSPADYLIAAAINTTPYIRLYELTGSTLATRADPASLPPTASGDLAFSPDGVWLAVGYVGAVKVYATADWSVAADIALAAASTNVNGLAFSPDSATLAIGQNMARVTVVATAGWTVSETLAPPATAHRVRFSPDGAQLAVALETTPFVAFYRVSDWQQLADPETLPGGTCRAICYSPTPRSPVRIMGFVRNPRTGHLNPDSASFADAADFAVFDSYVADPVAAAVYETPEIDIGVDAEARVWGDVVAALGPGATGDESAALQVDTRAAGGDYDGYQAWSVGQAAARFVKGRVVSDTAVGVTRLDSFSFTVDAEERNEKGTVAFTAGSPTVPLFAFKEDVAGTGFTIKIYDGAGDLIDTEAVTFATEFVNPPNVTLGIDLADSSVDYFARGV